MDIFARDYIYCQISNAMFLLSGMFHNCSILYGLSKSSHVNCMLIFMIRKKPVCYLLIMINGKFHFPVSIISVVPGTLLICEQILIQEITRFLGVFLIG